jgi:hypothetical protein
LTDTYKVRAGDRAIVISGRALRSESVRTLKEALSNVDDEYVRTDLLGAWAKAKIGEADDEAYGKAYLGDWGPRASGIGDLRSETSSAAGSAGAHSGNQSFDPLRARVDYGYRVTQPWDDPLEGMRRKAEDTIAVMGDPDPTRMDEPIPVYYSDRWAGKPWNVLADEAVELLRDKKGIDIGVRSKQVGADGVLMTYEVHRDYKRVIVDLILKPEIFDRTHKTELDGYARLMKKFDTHTYIVLRIAYVLGQAYKIGDRDALRIDLPVVRILRHTTEPDF